MKTIRSIRSMQKFAREASAKGKTIGLVPTMGYLHDGHLSLVRRAVKVSDVVVVTIFVNPAQFGPKEDLDKYPRDEKGDIAKIKEALGRKARSAAVFVPKAEDIYPDDFDTWVEVKGQTSILEGKSRPTHFRGVTTVVAKLFNITRPDVAVFGQKDFQQAVVLKKMARDLGYPVKMVIGATVREDDGLAMSSRNKYFDDISRWEAVSLYYALRTAKDMVKAGIRDPEKIAKEMAAVIGATSPTAKIDYIAFNEHDTLKPADKVGKGTVCSLAVKIRGVRLIDNMKLG
ncbi:pantoate--beta-alanine ligase [candidate division GN15 bacterium]|nr:pantoate--beta-alanine ligase [candidate division GN15 bacterium]